MITADDLKCRCRRKDCDAPAPESAFVEQLQAMEQRLGEPLTVTSGVRCRVWNEQKGGTANSGHLRSTEADLACTTGAARFQLLQAALSAGFTRLGIGKNFLHVGGLSTLPQRVIWHYYVLALALLAALSLQLSAISPASAADELLAWDLLRNSLVEIQLDTDGDGLADRTELHIVAHSGRTVLTDAELDRQAEQDHCWLFIVEEDNGRLVYFVEPSALAIPDEPDTRGTSCKAC